LLDNFMPRLERKEKQLIIDYLTEDRKHWTLVAISNNPEFAKKCDRVIIMEDGKILENDSFENIKLKPLVKDLFKI
jgi:ABC-type bacteriocin/lantibiotic exporter with double-glycine peptidase domain